MAEAADNYNSSVSLAAVLILFYLTRNQTFLRALEQPNVWPSTLFLDVQSAGSQPFYWEKENTSKRRWKKYNFPQSIITNFCSVEFDLKKKRHRKSYKLECVKTVYIYHSQEDNYVISKNDYMIIIISSRHHFNSMFQKIFSQLDW